ncbi:sugar diacid recognition domain-containing protein [Pasteurella oralis]|uniref:Sugar diacid recognition domain-containing protein n=1 Tax=Pasteurella oralis TaxID=1071947 RepID=A0ABW4P0I9_9PAST|nr:sugar diacid recognition domain-containing protein [Pasteurella oralis]MDO5054571.1 sugar diacid recognition domain-containing protein [Pasteurella oralis]
MKINKQTAQKIVSRTMNIIQNSVNVMDENGIIIASGDSSRVNQKHIGAIVAIRENKVVEIDQTLAEKWNFEAKPGINMPINYLGNIVGAVGISGEPDKVRSYTELVKMTAELIIEQYILLEQERWLHRYKEEFILQLLDETQQITQLKQQAHFFDVDLQQPYIVVIIQLSTTSAELLQELITYLQQPHFTHHLAILALDKIVLLLPQTQIKHKELAKLLPETAILHNYHIAVGGYFTGESKIHYSYQTALSTLEYGLQYHPKKTIYFFEQYQLPVLLQNLTRSWQAEELLKPIQKLIQQDQNHLLRKTLQQYFLSNCDLSLTSQKLFIHINTLRYRLHKIEQITSLSFNKITDLFILYLGTLLLP